MTDTTKKPEKAARTVVTEGNIAFDKDGRKCRAGDEISLPADALKALKDAGIVK